MSDSLSAYVARRVLAAVPVVVLVTFTVFGLVRLVPGGPAVAILGADADPAQLERLRRSMGLHQPIPVQYAAYLWDVAHLELGRSYVTGQPVATAIAQRLPRTLWVTAAGFVVSLSIALPAGTIAALRRGTGWDYAGLTFGLLGVSIPNFYLGVVLLLVFGVWLDLFPVVGYVSPLRAPVAGVRSLVLPGITLGTAMAAVVTRLLRAELLDELGSLYLDAVRMKGVSEARVLWHALKNAFVPVLTVVGMQFGYLLGGSVVIEAVFSIPGMGRLLVDAVTSGDYRTLQGVVLVYTILFVLVNLVVDVAYRALNPRLGARGGRDG
ncbi:MAG: ABC transporter permease [Halobacteriaceae archaeon]